MRTPAVMQPVQTRRYAGKTPDERRSLRRSRLVDAGFELFGTRGYASTTIESLCSHAGVTARHFYDEFPTREALLREIYDRIAADVLRRLDGVVAQGGLTARALMRLAVDEYVRAVTEDRRRAQILVLEVIGVSRELETHRRGMFARWASLTMRSANRLRRAPGDDPIDVAATSLALTGAALTLIGGWLLAPAPGPVGAIADTLFEIWSRCFRLEGTAGDVVVLAQRTSVRRRESA